jgi:hypothetical protein
MSAAKRRTEDQENVSADGAEGTKKKARKEEDAAPVAEMPADLLVASAFALGLELQSLGIPLDKETSAPGISIHTLCCMPKLFAGLIARPSSGRQQVLTVVATKTADKHDEPAADRTEKKSKKEKKERERELPSHEVVVSPKKEEKPEPMVDEHEAKEEKTKKEKKEKKEKKHKSRDADAEKEAADEPKPAVAVKLLPVPASTSMDSKEKKRLQKKDKKARKASERRKELGMPDPPPKAS